MLNRFFAILSAFFFGAKPTPKKKRFVLISGNRDGGGDVVEPGAVKISHGFKPIENQESFASADQMKQAYRRIMTGFPDVAVGIDWFQCVKDFHVKFAPQLVAKAPNIPEGAGKGKYCLEFIEEELRETRQAMESGDLVQVADGLADLVYVVCRASIICGIDLRPVFVEVHRSNMRKVGGATRADQKVLKPEGWVPPDVAGIIEKQREEAL